MLRCCCPVCLIHFDEFTVDLRSTDYSYQDGSWTYANDRLNTTTNGTLISVYQAPNPNIFISAGIVFNCSGSGAQGGKARIYFAWVSPNENWYVELTQGATITARLYHNGVEKGVVYEPHPFVGCNTLWTMNVCYDNGAITVTIQSLSTGLYHVIQHSEEINIVDTLAGLGAEGNVSFNSWTWTNHRVDMSACNECNYCKICNDGLMPEELQLEISGFSSTGEYVQCFAFPAPPPGPCHFLNSTFILRKVNSGLSMCSWVVNSVPCILFINISFSQIGGPGNNIQMHIRGGNDGYAFRFHKDFGTTQPDCMAWQDLEVIYDGDLLIGCNNDPNIANVIMKVTAL